MSLPFLLIAGWIVAGAVAATTLRNLVHCALALAAAFAGLAALYLQLGAPFVGFAQLLVYVGAVAILILFAILLTREASPRSRFSASWAAGLGIATLVFVVLCRLILSSRALPPEVPPATEAPVRQIGTELMTRYVLPLEVIGLLLTAALIGAALIALREKEGA
jgi:NADH-quinone oxidoreductase subunit J